MSKISYIKIENFRKLKKFEHQFLNDAKMVCVIGRGDSGKSTMLEAISLALSSSWNISFNDTDFSDLDVSNPIRIEVIVYELPDTLYRIDGVGYSLIFLNKDNLQVEEPTDISLPAVRIVLTVASDLEPRWLMVNSTSEVSIKAADRGKFNVFLISDSVDKHFSWNKGTPLSALLKKDSKKILTEDEHNEILKILRTVKDGIDNADLEKLAPIHRVFAENATRYGCTLSDINTSIDWKDLYYNEGRLCLHEGKIPLRLNGKGTKRLLSVALQLALIDGSGIILIDEIEQGLEPDRVQQFVSMLKKEIGAQVFITTHSSNVVLELNVHDLFRMQQNALYNFPKEDACQGYARTNPESFFAKRIIVGEGATESGVLRAVNSNLRKSGGNFSASGIRIVDGKGASMIKYCNILIDAGYEVCLLCDNDRDEDLKNKESLRKRGAFIIETEKGLCFESQLFKDLLKNSILKLIALAKEINENIDAKLREAQIIDANNELKEDSPDLRYKLGILANGRELTYIPQKETGEGKKKKEKLGWFKSVRHGEQIGVIIFDDLDNIKDTHLANMFNDLKLWING